MEKTKCCEDKGSWAIGGGVMLGLGVGFIILPIYGGLAFVGSLIGGVGLGLILSAMISRK